MKKFVFKIVIALVLLFGLNLASQYIYEAHYPIVENSIAVKQLENNNDAYQNLRVAEQFKNRIDVVQWSFFCLALIILFWDDGIKVVSYAKK